MAIDTGNYSLPAHPRAAWEAIRLRDLAVIGAVPLVLVAVYALPEGLRRSLVFDYADPSLLTAYVAPFVHIDASHLLVNLVSYAVVVPVVYALNALGGTRRRFWIAFLTFVVVFPPILSALNLAVPRPSYGVGYSGIVLAFVGFLPISIAEYAETHFDLGPAELVAPMTFFLGLALIAVLSVQSVVPGNATVTLGVGGLVVATLLCAALFWVASLDSASFEPVSRSAGTLPGYFELLLVSALLFVGIQFVAFPSDPGLGTGVVNLYVHLLGYALGFMVVYATITVQRRLPGLEDEI